MPYPDLSHQRISALAQKLTTALAASGLITPTARNRAEFTAIKIILKFAFHNLELSTGPLARNRKPGRRNRLPAV